MSPGFMLRREILLAGIRCRFASGRFRIESGAGSDDRPRGVAVSSKDTGKRLGNGLPFLRAKIARNLDTALSHAGMEVEQAVIRIDIAVQDQPEQRQSLGSKQLVTMIEMPDRQMPVFDNELLTPLPIAPGHGQCQDQEATIEDKEDRPEPETDAKQECGKPCRDSRDGDGKDMEASRTEALVGLKISVEKGRRLRKRPPD
jgi:hypothetical protein